MDEILHTLLRKVLICVNSQLVERFPVIRFLLDKSRISEYR